MKTIIFTPTEMNNKQTIFRQHFLSFADEVYDDFKLCSLFAAKIWLRDFSYI